MTVLLIANNCTRESGSFCGDQLCALKAAYMMVRNAPLGVDRVIMTVSPRNEMGFLWDRFVRDCRVTLVYDDFHPGDWPARWAAWDRWRRDRCVDLGDGESIPFDHYRELYLRIHGAQRQTLICGHERGLGRRNIYEYWCAGQEDVPDEFPGSDVYDVEIDHPPLTRERDVYVSPHCKTQGNLTFTFDFWADMVRRLVNGGVTVTVGYDGYFCPDLDGHPCFARHWGDHRQWMEAVCRHRLVACGNTGTGWLAAACGVPMVTMEPHDSVMADHRYRECGLRNIIEVVDGYKLDELGNDMARAAEYVARRISDEVRARVVMTTGCYDVLHAGHVRHLERARAMGTRLVVALNSDASVRGLKGPERPINPENQRKAVLEALRCVDEVRLFDGPDACNLIREVRPAVLACGHGYAEGDVVGRELLAEWGGAVAITCRGDARGEPSTTKIVRRVRASEVMEACRAALPYTVNPLPKLKLMAEEFLAVAGLPGDVADLGTCRGGTALVLRRLAPDKHLHLFDTWAGTPHDDPMCHHKRGEWAAPLEDCERLVGKDALTHYWRGVFPATACEADLGLFCFVYCDMDTYQSTCDTIEFFWPRLKPGGRMVFDDYGWEPCAGVRAAVDEAFPEAQRRVVQSCYTCVVEKQ